MGTHILDINAYNVVMSVSCYVWFLVTSNAIDFMNEHRNPNTVSPNKLL